MNLSLSYFGTNTLLIKAEDTHILVDPHFSRPSKRALLSRISPIPGIIQQALITYSIDRVDAILITHSHYDHALDAVEVAMQRQAVLYGSASMGMIAKNSGLPDDQYVLLQPNSLHQIGAFRVMSLPAGHLDFPGPFDEWLRLNEAINLPLSPPAWFWQYRAGQVFAFLLEHNNASLLLHGSAGLFASKPAFSANTAVLCIGWMGWKKLASIREWFRQMVLETGIQQLYLAHYDDFTKPFGHPMRWIPGTRRAVRLISQLAEEGLGIHVKILPYLTAIRIAA